jgi:hypothetical protein
MYENTAMNSTKWELIPDQGADYLDVIGAEVCLWNDVGEALGPLQEIDTEQSIVEDDAVNDFVETSLLNAASLEDVLTLYEELSTHQEDLILKNRITQATIQALVDLKQGQVLHYKEDHQRGDRHRARARLTVIETGVMQKRLISDTVEGAWSDFSFLTKPRELPVGSKIEGLVWGLETLPEFGGRIILSKTMRTDRIDGLVNPINGDPRVQLDFYKRTKKQDDTP